MADNTVTVHVTADDLSGVFDALRAELEAVGDSFKEVRERMDREERHRFLMDDAQGTALSQITPRLDAFSWELKTLTDRVQRIEDLPGVRDALAAQCVPTPVED